MGTSTREINIPSFTMQKTLLEQKDELKIKVCGLMAQKEKYLLRFFHGEDLKTIPSIQAKKKEIENQLRMARATLVSAKNSKRLLAEMYSSSPTVKQTCNPEEFESQKKEYVEKITAADDLQERLRSKRDVLISLSRENSSLQAELHAVTGDQAPRNPWMVGVPYGHGVKRDKFSDRSQNSRFGQKY